MSFWWYSIFSWTFINSRGKGNGTGCSNSLKG
jgi:hypothetical protein